MIVFGPETTSYFPTYIVLGTDCMSKHLNDLGHDELVLSTYEAIYAYEMMLQNPEVSFLPLTT